jgi:hypothetical protein
MKTRATFSVCDIRAGTSDDRHPGNVLNPAVLEVAANHLAEVEDGGPNEVLNCAVIPTSTDRFLSPRNRDERPCHRMTGCVMTTLAQSGKPTSVRLCPLGCPGVLIAKAVLTRPSQANGNVRRIQIL